MGHPSWTYKYRSSGLKLHRCVIVTNFMHEMDQIKLPVPIKTEGGVP